MAGITIKEDDMALGLPMATLGAAGIGALGSVLGSWLGQGEAPQQGYDVVTMPQYDWAEGNQQAASNYYNQGTQYISQGQLPPGFESYYGQIQGGLQQDSADRFYGTAGRSGTLRDILGLGSITGVGPKAAISKGMQAEYDFMTEGRKIDEYIAGLKTQEFSRQSQLMPAGLAGLARGPESQIVNMMGGVGGQSGMSGFGEAMGGIGQALGSMYGQGGTSQDMFQTSPMTGYDMSSLYGGGLLDQGIGFNLGRGTSNIGGASPSLFGQYKPLSMGG